MTGITLKPDPQKPGIYIIEEFRPLSDALHLRVAMRPHVWRPPTDVYETEDAIVVRVEVAGMRDADFSIILDGRYLSIRGVRPDVQERRAYHQMEIRFGEFSSDVELPAPVVIKDIEAMYSNGFLRILLPKARPQKINIEE